MAKEKKTPKDKSDVVKLLQDLKSPLSNDFKVVCEIYHFNETLHEDIWYSKLVDMLKGELSRATISAALDMLFDWGIIQPKYSETEDGKGRKLLEVSNDATCVVSELYAKYWFPYRREVYAAREIHVDKETIFQTFEEWANQYYHGRPVPQCRCHMCGRIDCCMNPKHDPNTYSPAPAPEENFEQDRKYKERVVIDKLRETEEITWDEAVAKVGSEERVEMLLEARREIHFYNWDQENSS